MKQELPVYERLQKYSLRASSPSVLAAGREKERELATTSPEFEYPHRKSRCEMLITYKRCYHVLKVSPGDTGWDVFSLDYHVDGPISTVSTTVRSD